MHRDGLIDPLKHMARAKYFFPPLKIKSLQEFVPNPVPLRLWGYLLEMGEAERQQIGERARNRVLRKHTAAPRVQELEAYMMEVQ